MKISQEIDRLVIAVHRGVTTLHRPRLQEMATSIGVLSPGHFYDLAEFVAGAACTVELAERRFRYEADNTAGALIAGLHHRELIGDKLRPAEPLGEVLATILQWRADVATNLWGTDLSTANAGAADALLRASGPVTEVFRSLPEPASPAHLLHHRLTGLRYARLDAHMAVWEDADLTVAEIVALTSAVAIEPVSPAPDGLVARRWLTRHGVATSQGHAARSKIEAQTDARCDALFRAVDDLQEWRATMRSLAPHTG